MTVSLSLEEPTPAWWVCCEGCQQGLTVDDLRPEASPAVGTFVAAHASCGHVSVACPA